MPYRPSSPCLTPGCPHVAVTRGQCGTHAAEQQARIERERGNSTQRGYGYEWQKRRAAYLKAHPWCACGEPATEVDHIVPKAMGGADDESNWQPLCKRHHSAKTMRESIARR